MELQFCSFVTLYDKKSDKGSKSVWMRPKNSGASKVVKNWLPTTHWPNGFLNILGYHFFWGWARMKPKAVLSLSLPCTSWIMLKYLKYAEIFEIFGKICQKYAERWNIFAQFTLPMTNESTSLISAYWHLYMSVELGLEAYLAHFTKYLQSGNNICESFKYHFQVPWLTQFDLPYQGTLFYRGCMV